MSTFSRAIGPGHLGFRNPAQFALMAASDFAGQRVFVDDGDGSLTEQFSNGNAWVTIAGFTSNGSLLYGDTVIAVSELWPAATLLNYSAVSQQVRAVACEFGGFYVRAVTGTVNLFWQDALVATTVAPLMTANAVAVGPYPLFGAGTDARRGNSTGLSVIMTGGGTCVVEPLVI